MLGGGLVFRLDCRKSNIVSLYCVLFINQKYAIYATEQDTTNTCHFDQRHIKQLFKNPLHILQFWEV